MNALQSMHQAHKDRLVRLRAIPVKSESALENSLRGQLRDLHIKSEEQQNLITELNAIIAKQRTLIRKFADETESPTPRIADVVAVIAEHYEYTRLMIIGAQRTARIAHARQVGYYICRDLGFPWLAIGRGFGKDHTSALHGWRQITDRLLVDENLALEIDIIKTKVDKFVARRIAATRGALA